MRLLRPLLGVLCSIVLLVLLFRVVDGEAMLGLLRRVDYWTLVPAVGVYFVGVWVRSVRWRVLLRPVAAVPTGRLFRAMVIGFTVNDLMPIRLGELARAFLLARWRQAPSAATLGSIVVERLLDGLTLCGIVAVAWFWYPLGGWLGTAVMASGAVFAGGALGAAFAALWPQGVLGLVGWGVRPLPPRARHRIVGLVEVFLTGLSALREGRTTLLAIGLSFAAWLAEAAMYALIMRGFGFDAGPAAAMLAMVAGNLGTMVPSSPGYLGTFDLPVQTVLTELFAVDPNLATSYTLVVHAALIGPVVLVGLALLWREGMGLFELSRRASGQRERVGRSTDAVKWTV